MRTWVITWLMDSPFVRWCFHLFSQFSSFSYLLFFSSQFPGHLPKTWVPMNLSLGCFPFSLGLFLLHSHQKVVSQKPPLKILWMNEHLNVVEGSIKFKFSLFSLSSEDSLIWSLLSDFLSVSLSFSSSLCGVSFPGRVLLLACVFFVELFFFIPMSFGPSLSDSPDSLTPSTGESSPSLLRLRFPLFFSCDFSTSCSASSDPDLFFSSSALPSLPVLWPSLSSDSVIHHTKEDKTFPGL